MKHFCFSFLFLLVFFACTEKRQPADQIMIGKIWTADDQHPWAEAIAITGDSIISIGSKNEVLEWKSERTAVIQLDTAQLIVPGFIDTHTHFVDGGFRLASVQLRDDKSKEE